MSIAAVEINDAAVTVAQADKVLASSPGFALISREPPIVGEAAQQKARQEPLTTNNRFWSDLDQKPLPPPGAGGRSRADLAWLHLKHLLEKLPQTPEGLIYAVPASMREPQLALLAGIAAQSGVPLKGMIDAAVAVASTWSGRGRFIYLDLNLHHALMSAVQVEDEARLERSEIKRGAGLLALHEAWARLIARRFVTQTRFDPLHRASDEQALFAALPGWVDKLSSQSTLDVEITFGSETLRVQLSREELQLEAAPIYAGLVLGLRRLRRAGHPVTIGISESVARLPGLVERLAQLHDSTVTVFPIGSAALAAAAHAGLFASQGDKTTLLRAAPRLTSAAIKPRELAVANLAQKSAPPTHVLYQGQAHILGAEPLIVGLDAALKVMDTTAGISRLHCSLLRRNDIAEVVDYSRYGTWLNDEKVSGRTQVHAGDRLRVGSPGVILEFIALE